ncbi:MAG: shikimate kinase AroL [Proteobacteria bacterium]|nr:shikimate kinase AroL [Pseudomonadota bacterium]MBU1584380.1 shikimate kinase AroL [Pseudomonadota bacterium]MBU2452271.1 shikimate kinase AroL [Pseudomonadota bacterium]MBU2630943.1 shikimate kinase AroL [Pseudomonadota bacterium]
MKIFLIGYRCTGKTTIGKLLANRLNIDFIDTDHLIEQSADASILQIVEKQGWEKFRHLEKKMLLNTKNMKNSVIATGGGIILDPDNQQYIKNNGFSIWLDADINTILHRLNTDHKTPDSRPSLTDNDLLKETEDILKQRKPLYEKTADIRIDTSVVSPEEIVNIIDRRLP